MNETTMSNETTTVVSETTTQEVAIPIPAEDTVRLGIIIGAAVGGACAIIIIICLLVRCIKSKRSNINPPRTLPDPYAMPRFEYTKPSISSYQSEVEVISRQHSNHLDPVEHTWEAQKPVIHSSADFTQSDRTSYAVMIVPSRPISISPPSPEQKTRGSKQDTNKMPPPVACKSPSGYINVANSKVSQSPGISSPSRKGSNFSTKEIAVDELFTREDGHEPDNYENVQEIILAERNNVQNNVQVKEKSPNTRPSSRQLSDHRLPDLLTGSFPNKNRTDNDPVGNSLSTLAIHQEDLSSSDSDTPASPKDAGSPTSYVNVDQYKKRSPVKESVIIDLSRSTFPELVTNNLPLESRSLTRTKPSLIPKPKPTQQKLSTETNIDDTYQINADLFNVDKSGKDNVDKSRQGKVDQRHRKLSTRTGRDDTNSGASRKKSFPTPEMVAHSAPTKFQTTGNLQKKDHRKGAQDRRNKRSRSHSCQDDIGIYQNCKSISSSESTLSQQSAARPAHCNLNVIHSKATSESDSPSEFEFRKPSLEPSKKMSHPQKSTSQQSSVAADLPRSPVKVIKLESSPSSDEIHNVRSNLRKAN